MNAQRRFRIAHALLCGASLLSAGCMGGQTGGELQPDPERPTTPDNGSAAGDGCKERAHPIALADSSRVGFSGADVLAFTLGTHQALLHWSANTGLVGFGPESGDSRIDVSIEYRDGAVFFVEPLPTSGNAPGGGPAVGCRSNHLEIEVVVRVVTAGGALAEEFPAALVAVAPGRAEVTRRLRIDGLAGSFFVTVPDDHVVGPLDVKISFGTSGFSGSLDGIVEQRVGSGPNGSVGAMYVPFAAWP